MRFQQKNYSKKKVITTMLVFTGILVIAFFISMSQGSANISIRELIDIIIHNKQSVFRQIVFNVRLPRTILAILVGINLALAGTILQAIMKNPLADPGIIGVSAGAGLFGVVILILFPDQSSLLPGFAFFGAMIASGMVYVLSWDRGFRPLRLILAGVAVSAFFGAGVSALLIFYSDRVQGALLFLSGSFSGTTWSQVRMILPYTIIGVVLTFFQRERLNLLLLGEETARSLGLHVGRARLVLTSIAALLAASSVSVVGLLGFVGLIVPHMTRMLIGSNHNRLIPGAIILGGGILLLSDTFARNILRPMEIPVGVIMSLLGAPFFLFLLRKKL